MALNRVLCILFFLAAFALPPLDSYRIFITPQTARKISPTFSKLKYPSNHRRFSDNLTVGTESSGVSNNMARPNKIQDLQEKLASSGRAGLLAYGILNCLYYTTVTALTLYVTSKKQPLVINSGATLFERNKFVISRLCSVAGTVYVGSQITKIFRLSGAVICAPLVDNLMTQFQKYFKLPSKNAAFWFMVALLWASVIVFYSSLVVCGTSILYMSALETIL